jgi:hypothetical protein
MPGRMWRRRWLACALVPACLSCHLEGPFARDNLWDLDSDAVRTLVGPDSTFAVGDLIHVTLTTDPPLPPGAPHVRWFANEESLSETKVLPVSPGVFRVLSASAAYLPVAVSVRFDEAIVAWTVWVGQKLATFDLYCGSVTVPACDAAPLAAQQLRTVGSVMADARGVSLAHREALMARATVTVRSPGVVDVPTVVNVAGNWTVRGLSTGSSWVVISADGISDSVRFVVP